MSKYKNFKFIGPDGGTYDSKKEYERWLQLLAERDAGKITDLRRQVKYVLVPSAKDENKKTIERAITYIADFVYMRDGQLHVEDVKPTDKYGKVPESFKRTAAWDKFTVKRKLMLFRFGIKIEIV